MKKYLLLLLLICQSAFAYDPNHPVLDSNPLPNTIMTSGSAVSATNPFTVVTEYGSITSNTDHYGTQQYLAPNGEVTSVPLYKLIGDAFFDSVLDAGVWTSSIGTAGSAVASGGQLLLSTGTTANNVTSVTSVHIARFSGLAPNKVRIPLQIIDGGTINNVREWGVFNTTDGAFFRLDGTTLRCVTRKNGVDTIIASSGGFNGQFGASFSVGVNSHFYEIIYQPRQVVWLADNQVIHTYSAVAATWTDTLHLPIRFENYNTNGLTTNVTMEVRLATVARFGIPQTQVDGFWQSGLTAGLQIKYGPGNVHYLIVSGVTNNAVVTLYDGTSTAGSVIFSTGPMSNQTVPLSIPFDGQAFNNGLFLTITGAAANANVIFD